MPRPDNAVLRLATFLDRLDRRRPLKASPEVARFVTELAAAQPRPARDLLPLLLKPGWSGVVLDWLVRDRAASRGLNAVLRNTATPTVLRASGKVNIAVGSTEQEFLAELRRLADPWVDLEVVGSSFPPTVASPDTDLFRPSPRPSPITTPAPSRSRASPPGSPLGGTFGRSWDRLSRASQP